MKERNRTERIVSVWKGLRMEGSYGNKRGEWRRVKTRNATRWREVIKCLDKTNDTGKIKERLEGGRKKDGGNDKGVDVVKEGREGREG